MKTNLNLLFLLCFTAITAFSQNQNTATIDASSKNGDKISRFIYGHFSEHLGNCIYDGIWVGENSSIPNKNGIRTDVVEALRQIKTPSMRWPGGCFADEYHWKDGIGPKNERPKMINTNWGGVTEDNSFGTHEFMELCEQLNCEAYISGNLGSGTVQEMSQWVEYLNSDNESPMTELRRKNGRNTSWGVQFWGVGNESWGCGGRMQPEYYANMAMHYSTFLKNYGNNRLKQIAVGANSDDYEWTDVVMRETENYFWGLALHYYTGLSISATDFKEDEWFEVMKKTLHMEELIQKHSAIMDKYDPAKNIALVVDEWGTWYQVEPGTNPGFLYQQNSLRDALVAGINLNIFNNHCDRVKKAAIAQVVNVLQAMILTKDEKMLLTPTYHVFDMYKVHHDAYMVPSELECGNYTFNGESVPSLNMSSSINNEGKMHISICNLHATEKQQLTCNLKGYQGKKASGKIVTAPALNTFNSFENPDNIGIEAFSAFKLDENQIHIDIPPHSVITIEVEGELTTENRATKLQNPIQGLQYKVYNGIWHHLPNFDELKPITTGQTKNIVFPQDAPQNNFGLVYNGYLKIDNPGLYSFSLISDDGSKLILNEEIIIENDGRHGNIEREGIAYLHEGFHKFELQYFQVGGGSGLQLTRIIKEENGYKKIKLGDEYFWQEEN